ncbi:maternal effect protein oskar-like [Uranotaenia lowii]|uniref:maternal effect protein oskar-like n=1 Tax=Uranotaenia lowii TaxID=190385 RepID=UPI00247914F5|nr:maternal effect protein oskar-like [Uranotaenia lowii]
MVRLSHHENSVDVSTQSEATENPDLIASIQSIIISRIQNGATVQDIIKDYENYNGVNLESMYNGRDGIAELLRRIPDVWSVYKAPYGPYLWYCSTKKSEHLVKMIANQKTSYNKMYNNRSYHPLMRGPNPGSSTNQNIQINNGSSQGGKFNPDSAEFVPGRYRQYFKRGQTPGPITDQQPNMARFQTSGSSQGDKFYPDNVNFIPRRNAWKRMQQRDIISHPYLPPQPRWNRTQKQAPSYSQFGQAKKMKDPNFCGYQMIGDDFFLSLAAYELGSYIDKRHYIQQSGLCISGLTIAEAADRVLEAPYISDRVMINVGAVDLLHGHKFIDMQQDLRKLIENLNYRGAADIIVTTVSPLANCCHIVSIVEGLEKFNNLIRSNWKFIDVHKYFVDERGCTLRSCFQEEPRKVTGSLKPHWLWNKVGRQRILDAIKADLGALY